MRPLMYPNSSVGRWKSPSPKIRGLPVLSSLHVNTFTGSFAKTIRLFRLPMNGCSASLTKDARPRSNGKKSQISSEIAETGDRTQESGAPHEGTPREEFEKKLILGKPRLFQRSQESGAPPNTG